MDITLVSASIANVPEMCEVGRRAFANDGLQNAIFPPHLQDQAARIEVDKFLKERMIKRLESPSWQYILATIVSSEGHVQIVGYAGWVVPVQPGVNESDQDQAENLATGLENKQESHPEDTESYPKGMDVVAYKHALGLIEGAQKETLGDPEQRRVWSLMSLAVDPEFKGKGIASKLVEWGTDKADADGLPAYLESSPAAAGVYERLGFKVQKRLNILKNDENHSMPVMLRAPVKSVEA